MVDFFPKSKSGGGERHETTGNTPQELLRQEYQRHHRSTPSPVNMTGGTFDLISIFLIAV